MQKDHDLSDHLLRPPGIDNPRRPHGTNPVHLAEAVRRVLDEVKDLVAKGLDELPGVDGPDAANHSRGEVLLNALDGRRRRRSEEHTSELQSLTNLVCRLLLEKKKKKKKQTSNQNNTEHHQQKQINQ